MCVTVACLQYFLEEGQSLDWFESSEIRIAAAVTLVGLATFIVRELTVAHPAGNFVKVVQRVPVHVVWNGPPPDVVLEPGMSVVVRAHVR